jgi:hypothetical protein
VRGERSYDPVDDRQVDPEHKLNRKSQGAADSRDLDRAKGRQRAVWQRTLLTLIPAASSGRAERTEKSETFCKRKCAVLVDDRNDGAKHGARAAAPVATDIPLQSRL